MKAATAVCCALALWVPAVWADILVIENQGNTPVALEEADVSMDSEFVSIEVGRHGGFDVTCTFVMTSHADAPITRKLGFPVVSPLYAGAMSRSFRVSVDGEAAPVRKEMKLDHLKMSWEEKTYWRPDHTRFDYPGYITWQVTWQPGQSRTVICKYSMGGPERLNTGLVRGWRFLYVVRTGALWKGRIGKADIQIDFKQEPHAIYGLDHAEGKPVLRWSYPDHAEWKSDTQISWHFTDWEPEEDITIDCLAWKGLEDYRFLLPRRFRGASAPYTDADIEELVDAELEPWKETFRDEIAALDRERLKAIVAEWLYHEILARHGDPFIVGSGEDRSRPREAVSRSSDGYLYSRWHGLFMRYLYHGGWYRPEKGKLKVEAGELNQIERQNLDFLSQCFAATSAE